MSINFRIVSFFVACAAVGLSACSKPDTDVDTPNFDKMMEGKLYTCSKTEAELPFLEEAAQKTMHAEDDVTTQDVEVSGCEGEALGKEKKTVDDFTKDIIVENDINLTDSVGSVVVENLRTCATTRADADLPAFDLQVPNPDGGENTIKMPTIGSKANLKGDIKIALFESKYIISSLGLNVIEGKNVLLVTYFGKCRKYEEQADGKKAKCLQADQIGQKKVLLQVKMNRIHKEEIGQHVRCESKPPKSEPVPEEKPEENSDSKPGAE